ncbi:DUF192 domain-containing protein [Streptomyces sp. JJ66]|uniref:DUF192 domain-containing protein n=1 Tax=Streptomyces sp. JJ66 TaxID=2803843 RepID=UPI001C587108|nr:DUF192 domain-containing protein [Streptomyces sp. JJ66]MBW1602803.1 DUF192 domain-containing protein [Streptomyces sp. JJ66]
MGAVRRPRPADGTAVLRLPHGGTVPVEVAASLGARTRGLLGRDGIDGALLLTPAASVHTFRMRCPIDVAYLRGDLADELTVLAVCTMPPGRLGLPRPRARHVLEAAAGALAAWEVRPEARLRLETRG